MCEESFSAHATFFPGVENGHIALITTDEGVSVNFVRVLEAADVGIIRGSSKRWPKSLPSIQLHMPAYVMEALVELYERSKK